MPLTLTKSVHIRASDKNVLRRHILPSKYCFNTFSVAVNTLLHTGSIENNTHVWELLFPYIVEAVKSTSAVLAPAEDRCNTLFYAKA